MHLLISLFDPLQKMFMQSILEQALFRALKMKHDTPKYGLIFHASLVGQAQPKHKVSGGCPRAWINAACKEIAS